jgi:hypothetical protein
MTAKPAKIGRVRLKNGAELHVLERKSPNLGGENWCGKIVDHARTIAGYDQDGSRLVGYFIMGLFSDGFHSSAYRYDPAQSPIPRRLLPAYVAETIREDMITDAAIERKLDK